MLLPSLYTPHPGVNATIAPSGLSMPPSHIYQGRRRTPYLSIRPPGGHDTYQPETMVDGPGYHPHQHDGDAST
jgi:hypothetical protein